MTTPVTIVEAALTVEMAAAEANVKPATIRRWFKEGLPHMPTVARVGATGPRREIVLRSELIAFIRERSIRGVAVEAGEAEPKHGAKRRAAPVVAGEVGRWSCGGRGARP